MIVLFCDRRRVNINDELQGLYDRKSDPQDQTDWSTDYAVPRKMYCATDVLYYVLYKTNTQFYRIKRRRWLGAAPSPIIFEP